MLRLYSGTLFEKAEEAKTLGACGPSSFGLGTSLGTTFTMIPPRLFQIMSHCAVCSVRCTDQPVIITSHRFVVLILASPTLR